MGKKQSAIGVNGWCAVNGPVRFTGVVVSANQGTLSNQIQKHLGAASGIAATTIERWLPWSKKTTRSKIGTSPGSGTNCFTNRSIR